MTVAALGVRLMKASSPDDIATYRNSLWSWTRQSIHSLGDGLETQMPGPRNCMHGVPLKMANDNKPP